MASKRSRDEEVATVERTGSPSDSGIEVSDFSSESSSDAGDTSPHRSHGKVDQVRKKKLIPFTTQQLVETVEQNKCVVAVRGKVYDLTNFVKRHPGGKTILHAAAGRDVTSVFETSHDLLAARTLKKFQVGYLTDNELPTFRPQGEFARTVRKRVNDYFKATGLNPKYSHWMTWRYFVVAMSLVVGYYLAYWNETVSASPVLTSAVCLLWGWGYAGFCMYWIHDGSHGAFTHKPWMWDTMTRSYDFVMGNSHLNWFYQHVMGHHPYTNIEGADPDIATTEHDVRRIKSTQQWHSRYVYQYIYCPLVYCLLSYKIKFTDYQRTYALRSQENIRINPPTKTQHYIFWGGKFCYVAYRWLIPYAFSSSSATRIIATNLFTEFVISWTLALIFQANHVVEEVKWPKVGADGIIDGDWAELQVETAQDYAHGSSAAAILTGGLNYQIVHHLFPQVSQIHHHEIAPIIVNTCKEFGVDYKIRNNIWEAMGGHIGLLKYLGSGEAAFGHGPHHEHHEH